MATSKIGFDEKEEDAHTVLDTSPKIKLSSLILSKLAKLVEFPSRCTKLEAINVFDTRWRVNAWTKAEETNSKIEKSWFVIADHAGNIKSFN